MEITYEQLLAQYGSNKPFKPRKREARFEPLFLGELSPPKFDDSTVALYTPKTFDEYIGQTQAKSLIKVMIDAAQIEQRPIPNLMLSGPAGVGKTSLAKIILKDEDYRFTDGNTLNVIPLDLSGYLIVDEIHNTKANICDSLNLMIDDGTIRLIGCTTNPGMLPAPFRTRFRAINLLPYSIHDLVEIMQKVLDRRGDIVIPYALLEEIASRGRRTPRVTLQYLSFISDLMLVKEQHTLTPELLQQAFESIGVDENGLLEIDRKYLAALPEDRAVGIQHLSAVISVDKETIEQEIEPYLLSLKLIDRTSRGRVKI